MNQNYPLLSVSEHNYAEFDVLPDEDPGGRQSPRPLQSIPWKGLWRGRADHARSKIRRERQQDGVRASEQRTS